jgi:hypothetical protein
MAECCDIRNAACKASRSTIVRKDNDITTAEFPQPGRLLSIRIRFDKDVLGAAFFGRASSLPGDSVSSQDSKTEFVNFTASQDRPDQP